MKKPIAGLLCSVLLCMLFSGCSGESSGKILRYDLAQGVINLDPQFATDENARMIITNICEGLLVRGKDGRLLPGAAESYTVSPDGLVYTFTLRENAQWYGGAALTAADFVFAFRRLFSPESLSPFAKDYDMIENAEKIIARELLPAALGVTAVSQTVLEIRLTRSGPFFLDRLADPPAAPCNEAFFNESRGRYGLDIKFVGMNGPFYLERWDNEKSIYLRPNPQYVSDIPVSCGGVNIYIGRENRASDYAEVPFESLPALQAQGYGANEYQKTTWCIVFNQNSAVWGNPFLRQSLAGALEQELLLEQLPQKFTPASLLIPPACQLAGTDYRALAKVLPIAFDPARSRSLFERGLAMLALDKLPTAVFYVPDSADHQLAMGMVQQSWQKHLSAYVNIEPTSAAQIKNRYETGEYAMLLLPLTSGTPRAEALLSAFSSNAQENHTGYANALFDKMLSQASAETVLSGSALNYARAESLLLQDAVIIPIYTETSVFAFAPGVYGITGAPYAARLQFKYAGKE